VVRSAGVAYYVRDLVPGRAEGTRVAGESPGTWSGGGSAVLGLRGVVASEDFAEVFAGRDPGGARTLRTVGGTRAVAGVDLLFCAPQSVSLLHLLGPRELAEETGAAHAAAVADATGALERNGLGVRRTRGGVTRHLATTGAVAAGFVHRTSRALDPHLHTHLVTANAAQGVDGVWSALDTRRLFLHRGALGATYDASLRRELTERLGVAWERGPAGRWDGAGVDPVLTRLFSQRAASIDEQVHRLADRERTPGRRRAAFHAERPDKDAGPTVEGLRSSWRRRAADHGIDPGDLVRVVGRARVAPPVPEVDGEVLAAQLVRRAVRRPTLGRAELVAAVADAAPAGLRSTDLDAVADGLTRSVPPSRPGAARWSALDVARGLDSSRELLAAGADDPGRPGTRALHAVAEELLADRTHASVVDRHHGWGPSSAAVRAHGRESASGGRDR